VRHPNVVSTLDVVNHGGELYLVMEYIAGEPLSRLLATAAERYEQIELPIISTILIDLLEGLHAAHTATGPSGTPLHIVHRDVSPQNVLVGVDGVSRVVDFGVAKAIGRAQRTDDGQVKGKVVYMPPEQMGKDVDLRADLWAAGAVLWEMLAGQRLFADMGQALAYHTNNRTLEPPTVTGRRETPLDAVAMRALSREPGDRYQTAREMIVAIERAAPPAPARRVGVWTQRLAEVTLAKRSALVAEVEAYRPEAESGRNPTASSSPLALSVTTDGVVTSGHAPGRPRSRAVVPLVAALLVAAVTVVALVVVLGRRRAVDAVQVDRSTSLVSGSVASTTASAVEAPLPIPPSLGQSAPAPVAPPSATMASGPVRPRKTRGHVGTTAAVATAAPAVATAAEPVAPAPQPPPADTSDPRELSRRK